MTLQLVTARKSRIEVLDGRERFVLFPTRNSLGRRSIYALGFSGGRTKIGICQSPRSRFLQHWAASNGTITWVHLFGGTFDEKTARRIEREALAHAEILCSRIRQTECFFGLGRLQAIRCVRRAMSGETVKAG